MKIFARLALAGALLVTPLHQAAAQDAPVRRRVQVLASSRAWLGIRFEPGAQDGSNGARIEGVGEDTPAENAGLRAGDRILLWEGRPDVMAAIREADLEPGDEVRLRVARTGQADFDVRLVAAERPRMVEEIGSGDDRVIIVRPGAVVDRIDLDMDEIMASVDSAQRRVRLLLSDSLEPRLREVFDQLARTRIEIETSFDNGLGLALAASRTALAGAQLAEVGDDLGSYFGTDRGVLVVQVAPGTVADESGLEAGDVIIEANGEAISGTEDLRGVVGRAIRARERSADLPRVDLVVVRHGSRVPLTIDD